MSYTWNVVPKTFTDEVGQARTITGIQARTVSNIEFNKEEFKEHTLYICFVQDTGLFYGERNVSTTTFVEKMVAGGATEEVANATIKAIMKDLCFGTVAQMEAKASILAGLYGYELAVEV